MYKRQGIYHIYISQHNNSGNHDRVRLHYVSGDNNRAELLVATDEHVWVRSTAKWGNVLIRAIHENEDVSSMPFATTETRPATQAASSSDFVWNGDNNTFTDQEQWHAGNDGPGSGLDADTLDSMEAADFVAVAGDTMTGNLTINGKLLVDNGDLGGTSGDSVFHAEITGARHHLDFKEVRTADGTDWSNTTYKLQMRVDATNHQSIDFVSDASFNEHIDIFTGNQVFNTRFHANGNVGINELSPNCNLDVAGTVNTTIIAASTLGDGGGAANRGLGLKAVTDGGEIITVGSSTNMYLNAANNLYLQNAGNTKVTMLANGNFGIGTTSPGAKLDVNGDVQIKSANISNQENTDVDSAAAEMVAQVAIATYTAAFLILLLKKELT